ncbi:MAG TPA: hypothetical protein VMT00_10815 [Thermoanaerobaculia bacterium]|nr:hypothetical protein [Thermoanaerobaculia bacterium]
MTIIARMLLGVVFFFVGLAGLVLPILPGWLFLLLAAVMFFPNHRAAEWVLRKSERAVPRSVALLRRIGVGDAPQPAEPRGAETSEDPLDLRPRARLDVAEPGRG